MAAQYYRVLFILATLVRGCFSQDGVHSEIPFRDDLQRKVVKPYLFYLHRILKYPFGRVLARATMNAGG